VSAGDGGPAVYALFAGTPIANPLIHPIAVDAAGNVFVVDKGAWSTECQCSSDKIRKISAQTGIITTFAGGGAVSGSATDGGPATNTDLQYVTGVIVDGNSLYLVRSLVRQDRSVISRIDLTTGIITTVAAVAGFYNGLDRDTAGNFYSSRSGSIWKFSPDGSTSKVVAGRVSSYCPAPCDIGDGGPAANAFLGNVQSVRVNRTGDLFISANPVRFVSAATGLISTIAGSATYGCSGEQGSAANAQLIGPDLLALGPAGTVYMADPVCGQVFKLTPPPAYAGYVDAANCQTISGWALDKNRPGVTITVGIYDGSILVGTVTADQSRPDVASVAGDSGMHGFSYTVPASLRDGGTHNLHVVYESIAGSDLPGSPKTLTCASTYTGHVDTASCSGITGWIADTARPNQALVVTLWDGATQIASALANGARPDVGAVIGDKGMHGFSLALPAGYANGVGHILQVRYETSTVQVSGSPVTLMCGGTNYAGFVDSASCSGISGWIADRNRLNQALTVTLWDGATQIASANANGLRSDVGAYLGDNGLHAFHLVIPSAYANGVNHTLQVHYEGSAVQVPGSPMTLSCGGTNYAGYIDSASCSGISGWIADRNRPNQPLEVSLWEGSTQIATATADGLRADVGAVIGDDGRHAFHLAIPSAYVTGVSHTLQVHYESSAVVLGSPIPLACGTMAAYAGWLDHAACDSISGWAADKSRANQAISVDVLDGSSVIATLLANASRPDVGAVLGDAGAHGFSVATPSAVKDGKAHSIQVRYNGTALTVGNSPQTLQCGASGAFYAGYVDVAGCSVISGWAADRNALGTAITVEIYDGTVLLGTASASSLRSDVGTVIGDAGLHGFAFATPGAVKDGRAHTITVRPAGSAVVLAGAGSVNCAQ